MNHGSESLGTALGRRLDHANDTILIIAVCTGFALVDKDASDGQIGLQIDRGLSIVDQFLDC